MTVLYFAASLLLILIASELFTNAVEWAGFRLKLGSGATGSLLAALGTSLPETVVPIVALLRAAPDANAVAMGAVLGAPLLLLTLGAGFTGVAVVLRRSRPRLEIEPGQGKRDLGFFLIAYSVVAVMAVVGAPIGVRIPLAIALVSLYAIYVVITLRSSESHDEMPEPLHLLRWSSRLHTAAIFIGLQLAISLAGLVAGSTLFVTALSDTAAAWHLDPLILAVVLVPIATELPETMNSVLWIRSNDDGLAFGNVAGSATFQATMLGALGLAFTTWNVGASGILSIAFTLVTAAGLYLLLRDGRTRGRWLSLAAIPWVAFVVIEVVSGGRIGVGG